MGRSPWIFLHGSRRHRGCLARAPGVAPAGAPPGLAASAQSKLGSPRRYVAQPRVGPRRTLRRPNRAARPLGCQQAHAWRDRVPCQGRVSTKALHQWALRGLAASAQSKLGSPRRYVAQPRAGPRRTLRRPNRAARPLGRQQAHAWRRPSTLPSPREHRSVPPVAPHGGSRQAQRASWAVRDGAARSRVQGRAEPFEGPIARPVPWDATGAPLRRRVPCQGRVCTKASRRLAPHGGSRQAHRAS